MAEAIDPRFRTDLLDRKARLSEALERGVHHPEIRRLLGEVDAALGRIADGTYGLCRTCHDPIEEDRLRADPLLCFCLDHLTTAEQRALEQDLELAGRVQAALLPRRDLRFPGWEVHYRYRPAGPVGGDWCDFLQLPGASDRIFFVLADVSGKGVAASLLTAHLHALFRSLIEIDLPLGKMVARANRLFCESTPENHFATLVCGTASPDGSVVACTAGHWPPLVVRDGDATPLREAGLPLGLFCTTLYPEERFVLEPGDSLVLFTDGVFEARNLAGEEYGMSRLRRAAAASAGLAPAPAAEACLDDLGRFLGDALPADDLILAVLRRV